MSWSYVEVSASSFLNFIYIFCSLFFDGIIHKASNLKKKTLSSLLKHGLQVKAIYAETFTKSLNHDIRTNL